MKSIAVILEVGSKKTVASAADWPGWCRVGRDGETALQLLADSAPRYGQVLARGGIKFQPPKDSSALTVTARVTGNATTDFGAPAIILDSDREPVTTSEWKLWTAILESGWLSFDDAVQRADGRELRKGPRGGGRELDEILNHVLEADWEYLKRIAWTRKPERGRDARESIHNLRRDILSALEAARNSGLPAQGPRGGVIWPPRYFIRRTAWHVLDHVWEIEDRIL